MPLQNALRGGQAERFDPEASQCGCHLAIEAQRNGRSFEARCVSRNPIRSGSRRRTAYVSARQSGVEPLHIVDRHE